MSRPNGFSHRRTKHILAVLLIAVLSSCSTTPSPEPGLPPSASDLDLLGKTHLCDTKTVILKQWQGTIYHQKSWGSGEQLQRLAQSSQPNHDRFYFFNEEDILVGAVFRFSPGLNLQSYPTLRETLSQLTPSSAFFLDPTQLLQSDSVKSAVLYRTGDKTSTTQYLVLDKEDDPVLLVVSISIDPYEQLLSSYQETYLPGLVRSPKTGKQGSVNFKEDKEFLALQQFARGETALFSSCGTRQVAIAIDAYQKSIDYGLKDKIRLAESHHRLGLALRDKSRFEEAQQQLEQSLTLRPNIPEVINNLGSVLAQQGKRVRAVELFEQAIILRPNYARARFNIAETLEEVNVRRAIEEYETYLALAEGIPEEEARSALVQARLKRLKGK